MKRLLNTSSITGSAFVPSASLRSNFTCRDRIKWPNSLIFALQPGSTILVPVSSLMIAGPTTLWPEVMLDRSNNGTDWFCPFSVMSTRSSGSAGSSEWGCFSSVISDAPPMASTARASKITSLAPAENPYRALCAASKRSRSSSCVPKSISRD